MIHIFGSVVKYFQFKQLCVDNNVFRLHYKITAGVLILFSVLVSAYQFFGRPVRCLYESVHPRVVDTFCWSHATFSLPDAFEKEYGEEVPYPGVDRYVKGKSRVYHQYYQWVCFTLMLQALMFLLPHCIWKSWENNKMNDIKLSLDSPILTTETKEEHKKRLVTYLKRNLNLHKSYFLAYILCEFLNFVNVVGQIILTDKFLGNAFTKYGTKIIQYTEMDIRKRPDAMTYLFPKLTKCNFHIFGPSGSIEKIDVLCILPLNVINEKIYVFLWFWFIFVAVLSAFVLVYRSLIVTFPQARYFALSFRYDRVDKNDLQIVLSHCDVGDWFVLNLLAKNLESLHYVEVISILAEDFKEHNRDFGCTQNGDKLAESNI